MSFKKCTKCGTVKPLSEFVKARNTKTGLHSWCKVCTAANKMMYIQANPEKRLHDVARTRAKKRGLEFTIKWTDVVIPDTCPLLGIPLVWDVYGENWQDDQPSLDRIDSNKGYTPDNVWVVSWRANCIKGNATADELLLVATNMEKLGV